MRLAFAQLNQTVGDIAGNTERIIRALGEAEARDATFTLFPELAITGYPPEDLLGKEHFVEDNLMALEQIAAAAGKAALVGFVDRDGGRLYNAAALVGNHRVLQIHYKLRLPSYSVFDEERYFEPGVQAGLIELGGDMFGTSVCEDIWTNDIVAEAAEAGARIIFNLSASPYHLGKGADREAMLVSRAVDNDIWVAYCNMAGGQDELVFDGRSVLIAPTGRIVARAKSFAEDLLVVDFSPNGRLGAPDRTEPEPDADEEVYGALQTGLGDYVRKNGFTDVVIGLSGGIDSALTATLAADTLGAKHVHGVLMPSRHSSAGSVSDAEALADNLGIETITLPIEEPFSAFLQTLRPVLGEREPNVTEENLQARIRGSLLMALSNEFGWLTLATGNKSELSVGYSTLYGDMVGGFAPLKDVFKTRVYDIARWRNAQPGVPPIPEATMTKPPSAELRPDQTDQDSLPPYDVLDAILAAYVERDESQEDIAASGFPSETVARVAKMVDAAEYKRRQGPLGIKITPKAFGKDRRMPVTNRYRG